ncbi:MAG: hypothetical protein ACF8XB_12485 [Planctomycetota bacterium JB042]
MKIRNLAPLAPLAVLVACASTAEVSSSPAAVVEPVLLNEDCPFMGTEVDPELTSAYRDGEVGFCCPGCKKKWDALSDAEKAARLAE